MKKKISKKTTQENSNVVKVQNGVTRKYARNEHIIIISSSSRLHIPLHAHTSISQIIPSSHVVIVITIIKITWHETRP